MGKPTVYIIGGPSKVGKSLIAREIRDRKLIPIYLETDIIREHEFVKNLEFPETFIRQEGEPRDERARLWVFEFLKNYDKNLYKSDVIVEGVAFQYPEHTNGLELNNFILKKSYVWHNAESHAELVIEHAKQTKNYIYYEIMKRGEEEERRHLMEEFRERIQRNQDIKKRAEELGWKFFETTEPGSTKSHIEAIVEDSIGG